MSTVPVDYFIGLAVTGDVFHWKDNMVESRLFSIYCQTNRSDTYLLDFTCISCDSVMHPTQVALQIFPVIELPTTDITNWE